MNQTAGRGIYFLKNYGVKYVLVSAIDSIAFRYFKNLGHIIMPVRAGMVKKYLKKTYQEVFDKYCRSQKMRGGVIPEEAPIWICWWQGIGDMPPIAKACLRSIETHKGNHPIRFIDKNNVGRYIDVPDSFIQKAERGHYTIANFTDWLRTSLLYRYGGIWLDITTWINADIDDIIQDRTFFTIQHGLFHSWHVCRGKWMVGYFACAAGDAVMGFVSQMLYRYMEKEEYCMYYLLTDCVLSLGYDEIKAVRREIDAVGKCCSGLFEMQQKMNLEYQPELFRMNGDNAVNKLSYKGKLRKHTQDRKLTNYGYLIKTYAGD